MAHVLLAYHRYAVLALKDQQTEIESTGKFGRDALPLFRWWKAEIAVERACRTISDVFGPVGEHYGVRDRWEAHCAANAIKSIVGNYKDNRFNGIFETSAQIVHHRQEFIKGLKTVKKLNKKPYLCESTP